MTARSALLFGHRVIVGSPTVLGDGLRLLVVAGIAACAAAAVGTIFKVE